MVANVPYEFTRVAWYFGWPLGITDEFHQMMEDTPGMLEMGLGMAVLGIGGSILTHGLVQRWGEVYPRWIWFKAGRRVPPALAIVPASIVAVVLIPAGLMNIRAARRQRRLRMGPRDARHALGASGAPHWAQPPTPTT